MEMLLSYHLYLFYMFFQNSPYSTFGLIVHNSTPHSHNIPAIFHNLNNPNSSHFRNTHFWVFLVFSE